MNCQALTQSRDRCRNEVAYNKLRCDVHERSDAPVDGVPVTREGLTESERRRARLYGLSDQEYTDLLTANGGRCLVCHGRSNDRVIDHCHTCGHPRAAICRNCNTAVGWHEGLRNARALTHVLSRVTAYVEAHVHGPSR